MYNSPEDFIQAIKNDWEQGDFLTAQKLAFQAVEHYPEDEEVLKYAYILAPAMIIQENSSPEDRNLYEEWLKNNRFKYRNRWVALRKRQLVADAGRSNELKERVGDTQGLVMISIG